MGQSQFCSTTPPVPLFAGTQLHALLVCDRVNLLLGRDRNLTLLKSVLCSLSRQMRRCRGLIVHGKESKSAQKRKRKKTAVWRYQIMLRYQFHKTKC